MSRSKSVAALAVVTAAIAVAAPTADAATAPVAPFAAPTFRLLPGSLPCQLLIGQVQLAYASGNLAYASVVSNAFIRSGCGGAAI